MEKAIVLICVLLVRKRFTTLFIQIRGMTMQIVECEVCAKRYITTCVEEDFYFGIAVDHSGYICSECCFILSIIRLHSKEK